MARITLTSSFKKIPEGQHSFYVYDVKYDETFGQLDLYLYSESTGDTHRERFYFTGKDGEANEVALSVFSFLAHTILDDFEVEDIDPADLIGHRFVGDIEYQDVVRNGQTKKYARLGNKYPYAGGALPYPWESSQFAADWKAKQAKAKDVPATAAPAPKPEKPKAEPPAEDNSMEAMLAALNL